MPLKFYFGSGGGQPNRWLELVTKVRENPEDTPRVWQGKADKQENMSTDNVMTRVERRWGYVIAWEFRPWPGAERRFEEAYGPEGVWARLFRIGQGFVATELSRDGKDAKRYLTLDFWESKQAYETFRAQQSSEYGKIDAECENLTESEREIGQFERLE